ncbi:MAG: MlaD family protein [Thermodesulfobacteriota bacterium]
MATARTKFSVGIFLICGILLFALAIIWVGMSGLLEKGKQYAIYFNESVQGLAADSQVKYRGVPVGRVERIQVAPDGNLIQVVVKIDPDLLALEKKNIENLVAQMKSVGITGIMFIELDRRKQGSPVEEIHLSFPAPFPVIPSRPSDIRQIFEGVENIFKRIDKIDFEGISRHLKKDLKALSQAIEDANVKGISERFVTALDRINRILAPARWDPMLASLGKTTDRLEKAVGQADGILADNRAAVKEAIDALRDTLETASKLADEGEDLVSSTNSRMGELHQQLMLSLANLERATDNLNSLISTAAQDPAELILGSPPAPRMDAGLQTWGGEVTLPDRKDK